MKKIKSFKFELNQRVFILGKAGVCVVTGRGEMNFVSGGKLNWYSLEGGFSGLHPESSLITVAEARLIQRSDL